MSEDVVFDVIARDKASKTFGNLSGQVDRSRNSFMGLGKVAGKVFAAGAIYYGAKQVTRGLLDMGMAAIEDQSGVALLAKQLENSAHATKGQIAQTEKWITAQGKAFGVTDNDLRPAIARLATATHSVSKAQRLASLAMNVSAGTGKTLKQVTEALMKAQNGSMGGLSRLGVKTKDAAGHTITMAKAVKELAAQFGGAAATKAQTLQGKMDRLKVAFDETKESIGYALLPILSDLADLAAKKVLPAIQRFSAWLTSHKQDITDFAHAVGDALLPPLKTLATLAGDLARFLSGLPGPVKSFGIEVGVAALILPRLTSGLSIVSGGLTGFVSNLRNAETRTKAMGTALRNVAGVGGMVLLAQGAGQANQSLGFLEKTAGGALMGFSVGGPWGAAIGAGAGALWGLVSATHTSAVQMVTAKDSTKTYIDTLNHLTGATTRATRARILDRLQADETTASLVASAASHGVATRDIISAVMGEEGARERLNAVMDKASAKMDALVNRYGYEAASKMKAYESSRLLGGALQLLLPTIDAEGKAIERGGKATRQRVADLKSWREALKGIPRDVRTELRQEGYKPNLAQLRALRRQYDLTPKQVRTVIEATKVPFTVKQVLGLQRVLKDTDKVKPNLSVWSRTYLNDLDAASRATVLKTGKIKDTLTTEPGRAKPNFSPFLIALGSSLDKAKARASSGATAVGNGLKTGVLIGFAGTGDLLAAQFASAVRQALAAARQAADSHSPSRKTAAIGRDMGDGFIVGIRAKAGALRTTFHSAGADMVIGLVDGIDSTHLTMKRVMDKLTDYISRQSQKISDLMSKRADIVSSFGDFTSSVFTSTPPEGQQSDITSLIAFQQSELAKAARLKQDVARLLKAGLSRNLIQQLAASGQSGMDQIHALASGTAAQIQQLNALNAQTQSTLTSTGTMVGNDLYASDIKDAKRDKAMAVAMASEFRKVLREEKDGRIVKVYINGHSIHTALLEEKDRTRKGLDLG